MTDHDKTQKIERIKRIKSQEELIAMDVAALQHFERQAELARQRLLAKGVAA